MSILVDALTVRDYRSFEARTLEPAPATTILVGPNAAGKTNLIEALQLLCAGTSFRRPAPSELVREGASSGSIAARLSGEDRRIDVSLDFDMAKRSFKRNGKPCRAGSVRGTLPVVLFCPDHLDICKRSASVRRAALDDFGVQLNEGYAKLVSTYARVIEQRNALLKDPCLSRDVLASWDEAVASTAGALLAHRLSLLSRLRVHFIEAYRAIAPHERADVTYRSTLGDVSEQEGRVALTDRFAVALEEGFSEDRRRGQTLVGPHRDELVFRVNGREARSFGSQGQQRSVVLAWKMAEVRVTCDILGRYPLLLLDDVMSELDAPRRESIMRFASAGVQTVVTTTNLGYFSDAVLDAAKIVEVGDGG